ncbi:hypothetical protein P692DRAFT_201900309 [Suillus brevipes Sb2]|nr:hypothetical protein P692DRAFT_201900309 [Suillus brevipes Sb2]
MPAATASSIPSPASLKGPVDGHRRFSAFVSTQDHPSVGMIEQSLCHHLQTLLTEYYRLIAVLESQMGNTSNSAPGSQSDTIAGEETGLTLKRLDVWITEWHLPTREKMSNTGGILKYSDIAGLERSIDSAYSTTSARLFEVFTEKFHLLDHLSALKHYLLLGYSDFAESSTSTQPLHLLSMAETSPSRSSQRRTSTLPLSQRSSRKLQSTNPSLPIQTLSHFTVQRARLLLLPRFSPLLLQ